MNVYVEHGLFASQVEECVPILLIADISSLRSSLFLLLLLLLLLQFLMMVLFWCSTTFLAWLFCSTQKYLKKPIGCRSSFVVCRCPEQKVWRRHRHCPRCCFLVVCIVFVPSWQETLSSHVFFIVTSQNSNEKYNLIFNY